MSGAQPAGPVSSFAVRGLVSGAVALVVTLVGPAVGFLPSGGLLTYVAVVAPALLGLVALRAGWWRTAVVAWSVAVVVLALPLGSVVLVIPAIQLAGDALFSAGLIGALVLAVGGFVGAVLALLAAVKASRAAGLDRTDAAAGSLPEVPTGGPSVVASEGGGPAVQVAVPAPAAVAAPGTTTNTLAVLSLVVGALTGLPGAVLGHVALHQIRTTGERGRHLAIAGMSVGYVVTVAVPVILLNALAKLS